MKLLFLIPTGDRRTVVADIADNDSEIAISYPHWGSPNYCKVTNNDFIVFFNFLSPLGIAELFSSVSIRFFFKLDFLSPLGIAELFC